MKLTPEQQAQICPECAADPKAAPGRYCARPCRCLHDSCHADCHAAASWGPRTESVADVIYLPTPRPT